MMIFLRTSWTALIQAVINVKCTISLEVTEAKVARKAEKWWRFGYRDATNLGELTIIHQTLKEIHWKQRIKLVISHVDVTTLRSRSFRQVMSSLRHLLGVPLTTEFILGISNSGVTSNPYYQDGLYISMGFEAPRSFPFDGAKTKAADKHCSKPTSEITLYWFLFSRDPYNGLYSCYN